MNKLTFDHFFKIGLLILGIFLIIELHNYVKNGRYTTVGDKALVIDTQTGIFYFFDDSSPEGSPGSVTEYPSPKKK